MSDEELVLKQTLLNLKDSWNLIPDKKRQVNLDNFTSLTKGDALHTIYSWQCPDVSLNTYLVEYDNSYRLNIVKAEKDYSPSLRVSRYLCCYTTFDHDFPDFVIRPNNFADRLANLFLRNQVKIKAVPDFNHKYILESAKEAIIEKFLGDTLLKLVLETDKVHIEVRNNKCLVFFHEPAFLNKEYNKMLKIAKVLSVIDLKIERID